jgi:hypothetical protein
MLSLPRLELTMVVKGFVSYALRGVRQMLGAGQIE